MDHLLKKYSIDHLAMLTPNEQLVLHNFLYSKGYNFKERLKDFVELCGPPTVHAENH